VSGITVGQLKDKLNDYGDHLEVVAITEDDETIPIINVMPTTHDGMAVAGLVEMED
jgi:hypothetical protein